MVATLERLALVKYRADDILGSALVALLRLAINSESLTVVFV